MIEQASVFDSRTPLEDTTLAAREKTLLGFEARYSRIFNQLRLVFSAGEIESWSKKHHGSRIPLVDLVAEQYPLVLFHGDVGTGKTATAEAVANRLVRDTKASDSVLFKLSNRVRGSGKVGEIGTLLAQAFSEVTKSAGKTRRALLVIDEGDSLGTTRAQEHSHHEDKVAVNTLIQGIDEFRRYGGRVLVFLCTNRYSVLDAAILRRAAVVEEFKRPDDGERHALFSMDLQGLKLTESEMRKLVELTRARESMPVWTFSDIRTRLYPAALSLAFPEETLKFSHLKTAIDRLRPTPIMEGL